MKKALKIIVSLIIIFAFLGVSIVLAINGRMHALAHGRILTVEEAAGFDADCILVLGAGVEADGSPSHMLRDRLDKALELYDAGASAKLIMSGDHGRTEYNEVGVMKDYAIEAEVPSEDVFMDHAGFSTYESLYRVRDIFKAERIIIVTQEYHLYRALYIARELGLDAVGVSAKQVTYYGQTYRDAREMLARFKDYVNCIIMPEPTYLGEEIPVWGSGDATND